jgi:hypothetical protein
MVPIKNDPRSMHDVFLFMMATLALALPQASLRRAERASLVSGHYKPASNGRNDPATQWLKS